jgi:hypothetical protein
MRILFDDSAQSDSLCAGYNRCQGLTAGSTTRRLAMSKDPSQDNLPTLAERAEQLRNQIVGMQAAIEQVMRESRDLLKRLREENPTSHSRQ